MHVQPVGDTKRAALDTEARSRMLRQDGDN